MARDPAKLKGRILQLNLSASKNRRGPAGFYRGQVITVIVKRGATLSHVSVRLTGGIGQGYTGRRVTKVTPEEIVGVMTGKSMITLADWLTGHGPRIRN